MSDECIIVGKVDKSPIGSPPLKKLKQSRLPFAPINTKSPKQIESSSKDKKRKLSGSDESANVTKTPRSDTKQASTSTKTSSSEHKPASTPPIADENLLTPKSTDETLAKDEASQEKKIEQVVKRKGRSAGAKHISSPQSDGKKNLKSSGVDGSPGVKKRGRPVVSKKLISSDHDKNIQSESETTSPEKRAEEATQVGKSENEASTVDEKSVDSTSGKNEGDEKPASDEVTSLGSSQNGKCKNQEKEEESSHGERAEKVADDNECSDKSATNEECDGENSNESTQEGKSDVNVKKRGRPIVSRKSLTPQDDKPKRKKGRTAGAKNTPRSGSQTSLNKSMCSNPSDDEVSSSAGNTPVSSKKKLAPVEKTRKLLSLFTSKNQNKCSETSSSAGKGQKKKTNSSSKSVSEKCVSSENSVTSSEERTASREDGICDKERKESETEEAESHGRTLNDKGSDGKVIQENEKDTNQNNDTEKKASEEDSDEKVSKEKNVSNAGSDNEIEDNEKCNVEKSEEKEVVDNAENDDEVDDDEEAKESKDNLDNPKRENSVHNSESDTNEDEGKADKDSGKENEEITVNGACDNEVEKEIPTENEKIEKDHVSKSEDNGGESESGSKKDDLDESISDMEKSVCESEGNTSKTMSPGSSSDANKSPSVTENNVKTPNSSGPKSLIFTVPKKLTPKQIEKEAAKLLKMEERVKQKMEKEKQIQEKIAEKEKLRKQREDERKQKEEERKQKEEEKQKQKEEKEKVKEEQRKKRQEEIDAKRQKKEEELQKKEEEKQKKEEEQLKKEEEKRKLSDKLKNKFASFFVAKKREAEEEAKDSEGPFKEFRVKEDMQLAPVVRLTLSECQVSNLDEYMSGKQDPQSKTYLKMLKSENYIRHKSERTWPREKKQESDDDDDIMVIDEDEDDEDMGDINAMIQDPTASLAKGTCHKAKLLSFCENRRPAYWGTWSKKNTTVSARRPFAREGIFDYEYDSDDDWEEEEAGESLSDSEGEDKDEKEDEGDQYEVDNDFFVPHGYLSDDEGKSDQEEEDDDDKTGNKSEEADRSRNTEQLKLKQAEFEEEMKKKTKELKPRVIGCLWMADKNNNPAYNQLMKILGPHKAVTLCSQLPIGRGNRHGVQKENKEADGDDDAAADYRIGNSKKFVKTFPEEAVPALIKLLHGNRFGKPKLCREFGDYWRKLTGGELEENLINSTPTATPTGVSGSVHISKRKVERKIQELGHWKRCLDDNKSHHIMCWYVPKKTREEYGFSDLDLSNSWIYINDPSKKKKEDSSIVEDTPKIGKMRPITEFAKKIPSTPSSANTSPTSTPSATLQHNQPSKADNSPSINATSTDTPNKTPSTCSSNTILSFLTPTSSASSNTPSGKHSITGGQSQKKRVNLFSIKSQEASGPPKGSITSFFKKNKETPTQPGKETPTQPGKETPTQPGKETPTQPDKKTPTQPGKKTPTQPGKETPTQPGKKTPTQPGKKTPTQLGKKTPTQPIKDEQDATAKKATLTVIDDVIVLD